MNGMLTRGLVLACFAPALVLAQQPTMMSPAIATWNLGWLMDKATHTRWIQACSATGWKTEKELKAEGAAFPQSLLGLPYCDVHNGIDFYRDECPSLIGDARHDRPTNADSPDRKCRVSPDLADWNQYERKLAALRETFAVADAKGVVLIALQEVSNEDAVRTILPEGWEVKTTASIPNTPRIAQHVGVAWKSTVDQPSGFRLLATLSDIGDRPLRPGLLFSWKVKGQDVDFLAVHLKASCRSVDIDLPKTTYEKESCPVLAEQVAQVERWIDAHYAKVSPVKEFVLLGDFNRTLLAEMATYPSPDPIRLGKTPVQKIKAMAPEWNDDIPKGSTIKVLPHKLNKDGGLIAGDIFCSRTRGIDHIIFNTSVGPLHANRKASHVMQQSSAANLINRSIINNLENI